MGSGVLLAGLSPHPAVLVPEVGRGDERKVRATADSLSRLGKEFAAAGADTLVIVTPHGPVFRDAVSIRSERTHAGDLSAFGARGIRVSFPDDAELVTVLLEESERAKIPCIFLDERHKSRYGIESPLDHGVVVPLHFVSQEGFEGKVVVVNIGFLALTELYEFGRALSRSCARLGRRVGVLASGDLSHRLTPHAPAGYNPKGALFDRELVASLARFDVPAILTIDPDLIEDAGECGLRPIALMLGTLDEAEVSPEVLSYEGPFGVGYAVALFRPTGRACPSRLPEVMERRRSRISSLRAEESFPVKIARQTVEGYVRDGKPPALPPDIPSEFAERGGVFVSIHSEGSLRGCIGTIEPVEPDIAHEIVSNAVSACSRDSRFSPVEAAELDRLDYSVDVLSPNQECTEGELDPKVYGVICKKGKRTGLLLPDLAGVDTVEEQLSIAKRKAGIGLGEKGVRLYRFTVTRYR